MPCSQILTTSSTDYIAKVAAIDDSTQDGQQRGIRKYGGCYDARTDALAASLARSGKGPKKAVRDEFASLEKSIKDFTDTALALAAEPHGDAKAAFTPIPTGAPKATYASLYEKAFRYEFYEEYLPKVAKPSATASRNLPSAQGNPKEPASRASIGASAGSPAAGGSGGSAGAAGAKAAPHEATPEEQARSNADPVTQAKNRFGEILEELPDEQMHRIHAAFSEVIGPHAMSEAMRLAVYRYAIYLLQPPDTKTPEPPLF